MLAGRKPLTESELPSAHALRGELNAGLELLIVRPDGRRIPVSERAAPVYDKALRNVFGALMTLHDLSLQKEVEWLREELAAMVAHDLRNPIQAMLVQIQLLRRSDATLARSRALDRLESLGARLARLAGDLLDATRVEPSRVRLRRSPMNVVDATGNLVERIRPTLGRHDVVIEATERPRRDALPSSATRVSAERGWASGSRSPGASSKRTVAASVSRASSIVGAPFA